MTVGKGQPLLIVERRGKTFGFVETGENPFEISELNECVLDLEADIDAQLQRVAGLRLPVKQLQRLLEGSNGLAAGRPDHRKPTCLQPIVDRFGGKSGL